MITICWPRFSTLVTLQVQPGIDLPLSPRYIRRHQYLRPPACMTRSIVVRGQAMTTPNERRARGLVHIDFWVPKRTVEIIDAMAKRRIRNRTQQLVAMIDSIEKRRRNGPPPRTRGIE